MENREGERHCSLSPLLPATPGTKSLIDHRGGEMQERQ